MELEDLPLEAQERIKTRLDDELRWCFTYSQYLVVIDRLVAQEEAKRKLN